MRMCRGESLVFIAMVVPEHHSGSLCCRPRESTMLGIAVNTRTLTGGPDDAIRVRSLYRDESGELIR